MLYFIHNFKLLFIIKLICFFKIIYCSVLISTVLNHYFIIILNHYAHFERPWPRADIGQRGASHRRTAVARKCINVIRCYNYLK